MAALFKFVTEVVKTRLMHNESNCYGSFEGVQSYKKSPAPCINLVLIIKYAAPINLAERGCGSLR